MHRVLLSIHRLFTSKRRVPRVVPIGRNIQFLGREQLVPPKGTDCSRVGNDVGTILGKFKGSRNLTKMDVKKNTKSEE